MANEALIEKIYEALGVDAAPYQMTEADALNQIAELRRVARQVKVRFGLQDAAGVLEDVGDNLKEVQEALKLCQETLEEVRKLAEGEDAEEEDEDE